MHRRIYHPMEVVISWMIVDLNGAEIKGVIKGEIRNQGLLTVGWILVCPRPCQQKFIALLSGRGVHLWVIQN